MPGVEVFNVECHTRLPKNVLEPLLPIYWEAFKIAVQTSSLWADEGVKKVEIVNERYEIVDKPDGDDEYDKPHADFRFLLKVWHNNPVPISAVVGIITAVAGLFIALSIFAVTVTVVSEAGAGGDLLLVGAVLIGLYLLGKVRR